jgi:DNA replication protein DnaC
MVCEHCGRELPTTKYLNLEVPVPCDCEGARAEREAADRAERRENFRAVLRKAVASAKMPPRYRLYPEWGDGSSVYLYGEQGRGKTEMACGALRKWLKDGIVEDGHNRFFETRSGRFVTAPEFLASVRDTYGRRSRGETEVVESMGGVGLLVLDDLGKGQLTQWAVTLIYTIIDMRYRNGKGMVITSQYDPARLTQLLSKGSDEETAAAIVSRIEGMCKVARVTGRDWRTN